MSLNSFSVFLVGALTAASQIWVFGVTKAYANDGSKQISYKAGEFSVGLHYSAANINKYYSSKTDEYKNLSDNYQPGFEVNGFRKMTSKYLDFKFAKLTNVFVGFVYGGTHEAQALGLCDNNPCYKETSISFSTYSLNFQFEHLSYFGIDLGSFAGATYVKGGGKIRNDPWHSDGLGWNFGVIGSFDVKNVKYYSKLTLHAIPFESETFSRDLTEIGISAGIYL